MPGKNAFICKKKVRQRNWQNLSYLLDMNYYRQVEVPAKEKNIEVLQHIHSFLYDSWLKIRL